MITYAFPEQVGQNADFTLRGFYGIEGQTSTEEEIQSGAVNTGGVIFRVNW